MEKTLDTVKQIVYLIITCYVFYLCVDFLFNKEVSSPSEWDKYKNCQDITCCRHCYRGVFEKGFEYLEKGDIPASFQYELRDIDEHFSIAKISEYDVLKVKEEEIKRIESKIGNSQRVHLYWEKVFGLSYQ